jgi:signal transduction histidine kinase
MPNASRDPLLAAICHDLRAPLAAVTMGTNFVLQTTADDEHHARSRRILEAMLRSCAQMERLVRNFADLSEIESDALVLRFGLHDAGEMLDMVREAEAAAAGARNVTVEVKKPERPIMIECDRDRVLRALVHLLENAIKVAPEKSVVTLSVTERDGKTTFAVVDRGVGLTPQVRRNLFDRQYHARRANRVGAGLGLAIARGFAQAHGGSLHVDSRADEETTFSLTLPTTEKRNGRSDRESAARPPKSDHKPSRVSRVSSGRRRR